MDDLISRQALKRRIKESDMTNFEKATMCCMANAMPTIDAVPVVRCKDCARRNPSADLTNTVLCTWLHNLSMPKDGFCSYGERRDGEG